MLFYLIAGHFLADYPFQSDAIASCKCRRSQHPASKGVPWWYWLSAHAFVHGAMVGVVMKWYGVAEPIALAFALAETVIHWLIDFGKCEGKYSIHVDQGAHLVCKVAWWVIFLSLR